MTLHSPSTANVTRLSPALTRVAVLLGLSIFLNYIDRGTLSPAAPLLKDELHLSATQLGMLLSSFFWSYAAFQIVSGWLVDRTNANWILALGVFFWSAATLGIGFIHGFKLLLAMRLLLGMGESVSYPSCNKIIAKHFSESNRGRANALIAAGNPLGSAFGTFAGGMLMARVGWRLFFVVLGAANALWLFPWIQCMPRSAGVEISKASQPASAAEILLQRSAWGTFADLFSYNYLMYFLITWLPFYLVRERHLSIQTMSFIGGAAFSAVAVSALVSGWLSDLWIAAGASVTRVRKTFTGAGPLLASCVVLVSVIANTKIATAILILACAALGVCASNLWAVTQTLAGTGTAGRWTGLQNFAGNLAGVVAPALTGIVVDRTGHFFWAFAIASAVTLLGAASWIFVVGSIEPVSWTSQAQITD